MHSVLSSSTRKSSVLFYIFFISDLGMDEDEEEPVPLPNVNAAILKKVGPYIC